MAKILVLLIGCGLLILSVALAFQTRAFVATAQPIEGRTYGGDFGGRGSQVDLEFWIKHSEPKDPQPDLSASMNETLDRTFGKPKFSTAVSPRPSSTSLGMPEIVELANTHTRYTFSTYNGFITGIDRQKIPILYDPVILTKERTFRPRETFQLDTSQAMVNTFTSLYAYSIVSGVPGILFLAGGILAFLKSRYMGWRYFARPRAAKADYKSWIRCPGCKVRFNPKDANRWDGERHLSCGQRIMLATQE